MIWSKRGDGTELHILFYRKCWAGKAKSRSYSFAMAEGGLEFWSFGAGKGCTRTGFGDGRI